jgi:hypothetical protein
VNRLPILLLALSLAMTGCSALPWLTPPPGEQLVRDLAMQRQAWTDKGIDDYRFVVRLGCLCPPEIAGPFEITVVNGVATAVSREGRPVDPAGLPGLPLTIEAVFDVTQRHVGAPRLDVQFDPAWSFPADVSVDPIAEAVDDEFAIMILVFEPS